MLLSKLNLRKRKTIIDISFFHSSDCGFNIQGPPCEVTTCTFSTILHTRTSGTAGALAAFVKF